MFVSLQATIQVYWSRVPSHSVNGITLGYIVKIANSGQVTEFTANNSTFHWEIKHLETYKSYCIGVAAYNSKGRGPWSNKSCVVIDDSVESVVNR